MQHNLRDPSRDRIHGRVYRVTYEGRPLSKPARIAGASIEELLELLKHPEDRVRYRARTELGARDAAQVIAALKTWVAQLDKADPDYEHQLTEALWAHQYQDVVNLELLDRVLASPDFHARAAATRVLCVWRDRVPKALDTLKKLAADPYPLVRLEADPGRELLPGRRGRRGPLDLGRPPDRRVSRLHPRRDDEDPGALLAKSDRRGQADRRHQRGRHPVLPRPAEHRRAPQDEANASDRPRAAPPQGGPRGNPPRGPRRPGEARQEARADGAARSHQGPRRPRRRGERRRRLRPRPAPHRSRAAELTAARPELEGLATAGHKPVTRQLGYLALIAADGGVDKAWALASKSAGSLRDLVDAMPAIRDPGQRAALYPRVLPLLDGLPKALGGGTKASKGTEGRFVRIELRGRRTLTLAEVEVYSDGRNVAPLGKATQKNTAYGGPAERAIDGNKSGSYGDGGQTHTQENTANPWWEVDLGAEYPIDSVAVWNRTEGDYYTRLDRYTIKVLDASRKVVFEADNLPAQRETATTEVGGTGLEGAVRRSAMVALTSVRGKEAETFKALAKFVRGEGSDRTAAIRAIARIPARRLAGRRGRPDARRPARLHQDDPAAGPDLRERPRRPPARRLAGGLAPARPGDEGPPRAGRPGRPGDPAGHHHRPDALQQGSDRRPGRQAGRDRLREQRHHAAQLRRDQARRTRRGRPARRVVEHPARGPRAELRAPVRQDPASPAGCSPRATRRSSASPRPTKPGVYPYVCTYPGHWRRMYGAFYVVEDIAAYLADPTGYLAAHPLADPRRPAQEQPPAQGVGLRRPRLVGRRSRAAAGRSPTASRSSRSRAASRATG